MKLEKLIIKGLFGHFNHVVEFKDGNITIITAPNGYGKTMCLKIIDAIFNKKLPFLCDLQFNSIKLHTSNGALLIEKDMESSPNEISLSHSGVEGQPKWNYANESSKNVKFLHKMAERIPFLRRVAPDFWEDVRSDEVLDFDEIIERYGKYFPDSSHLKNYPEWLSKFSDSLDAHFIQDQRLIQRARYSGSSKVQGFTNTIEKYANELKELIRESGSNSSVISQQLDTTFPERLLKKDSNFIALDIGELKNELRNLQARRSDLSSFKLLSSTQNFISFEALDEIRDEDTKALTLYVKDTKSKLSSYDSIHKKIKLFSRILNNKRLSFKKIKIDSESGFKFETEAGTPLELTQLSSGEQHQVVLLYELIFKAKANALVLIDEPEISLHIAWQKEFLKDLKEIIEIQNIPVVIATHSPQIIGGDWELTVNLEEGCVA